STGVAGSGNERRLHTDAAAAGRDLQADAPTELDGTLSAPAGYLNRRRGGKLRVFPSPRLKRPVGTPVDDIPGTATLLVAVAVAGGALVVGTWWRAAPLSVGPGAALMDAGRLAGLLAGYVALLQVLLRARLPFVERGLGTDSINEAHHLLGGYIFALIIGHAALITTGYAAAAGMS